jgi:hypothetical protein
MYHLIFNLSWIYLAIVYTRVVLFGE